MVARSKIRDSNDFGRPSSDSVAVKYTSTHGGGGEKSPASGGRSDLDRRVNWGGFLNERMRRRGLLFVRDAPPRSAAGARIRTGRIRRPDPIPRGRQFEQERRASRRVEVGVTATLPNPTPGSGPGSARSSASFTKAAPGRSHGAARKLLGVMKQNLAIAQTSERQCINMRSPGTCGTTSRRFGCHQTSEDAWERPWIPPPLLASAAALLAETHLLGERRARLRIGRRSHRIIGGQRPFLAVLLGRHVVLGSQMPL
jgi:hypothetical protein